MFLLLFYSGSSLIAQNEQAPEVVQTSFNKMYPHATVIEWEFDDGLWEVELEDAQGELEVLFTDNGNWVETVRELKRRALPASIKSKVKAEYPMHRLDEVERVWQSDFDGYRIEMENRKSEVILMVTPDGVITNVVIEDEDD